MQVLSVVVGANSCLLCYRSVYTYHIYHIYHIYHFYHFYLLIAPLYYPNLVAPYHPNLAVPLPRPAFFSISSPTEPRAAASRCAAVPWVGGCARSTMRRCEMVVVEVRRGRMGR